MHLCSPDYDLYCFTCPLFAVIDTIIYEHSLTASVTDAAACILI